MTESITEKTDEQLIKDYAGGSHLAFETLYRRYKNPIYHYCFRQINTPALADELHQEIWLKVIKSSARFKQQSSFKTWLYKIAHNTLMDYYRKSEKRKHLTVIQTDSREHNDNSGEAHIQEQHQPDNTLQNKQLQKLLLNGIEELPREQKEVFLLHEKSGLSLHDIALVTQSSFESTKSRLRYAGKKLRRHLAHHLGVEL